MVQWRPTVENDGAVQWRRRGLPVTGCAPVWIGFSVLSVGMEAHSEPRTESHRPPPIFITQCDRGPLAIDGLGAC